MGDRAYAALIDLCVCICRRNNIPRLIYDGTANGTLTRHNFFANITCPGNFLQRRFPQIAEEVNRRLGATPSAPTPPTQTDGKFTVVTPLPGHTMNRHRAANFPNGIREVIFQNGVNGGRTVYQFSPVGNGAYARATDISALTRQAVDQVLDGVDHSRGALFFRSTRGLEGSWHQTALTHLFTHGSHAFFS